MIRLNPWKGGSTTPHLLNFTWTCPRPKNVIERSADLLPAVSKVTSLYMKPKSFYRPVSETVFRAISWHHNIWLLLQRNTENMFCVLISAHVFRYSSILVYIIFSTLYKCCLSQELIEWFFGRFSRHFWLADLKRGVRHPHSNSKFDMDRLKN